MVRNTQIFKELPSTLILDTHYQPDELNQLRDVLQSHGSQVTTSIFDAELVITKLTQEKRARREILDLIRLQSGGDAETATKDIDVVKEKWINKCIDDGALVDWPF